jgi:hypothetical protein
MRAPIAVLPNALASMLNAVYSLSERLISRPVNASD